MPYGIAGFRFHNNSVTRFINSGLVTGVKTSGAWEWTSWKRVTI